MAPRVPHQRSMHSGAARLQPDCPCRLATVTPLPGPEANLAAQLVHLYVCSGLSTYRIADATGLDRQRVTRLMHRAGLTLAARGAGRRRPRRQAADIDDLAEQLTDLYVRQRLDTPQVARKLGIPERTVRSLLRRYAIKARTKGAWNREDRRVIPASILQQLYSRQDLTADQVGQRLGTSRKAVLRNAHELGIPVRSGGPGGTGAQQFIELIEALYSDSMVLATLVNYGIPAVLSAGPVWVRFPEPVPLSKPLVDELYSNCGVGICHIELLTGQPAQTVRNFMQRAGINARHPGGRSPFIRRWRAALADAGARPDPKPGGSTCCQV